MKKILVFVFILGFTSMGMAEEYVPTAPVEGAEVSGAGEQGNQFGSCQQARSQISLQCTSNPSYVEAQSKQGLFGFLSQGNKRSGTAEAVEDTADTAKVGLASMASIRQSCQRGHGDCHKICSDEYNKIANQYNNMPEGPSKISFYSQVQQKELEMKQTQQVCKAEADQLMATSGAAMGQMGEILEQALAALAVLKGSGDGSGMSSFEAASTEEDDVCEAAGDNAQYMPSCNGNGDPVGSRAASLVGTGVGGLTSGGGSGDLMTASQGEPGGTSDPSSDSDSNFSGFGSASAGLGSGSGSGSSGSSGGAAGTGSGIDSDVHKGFMGASGSSSSGGFSGGGGSSSKASPFAKFSGSAGMKKAALNSKLNKLKNKQTSKRAPASTGGANGRFVDNWSVVSKAYKNNSKTLFHNQKEH